MGKKNAIVVEQSDPNESLCRGYEVRIYPSPEQAAKLGQWIGTCRYVWNWALSVQHLIRRHTGRSPSKQDLSEMLTMLRVQPDRPWLSEPPRACLEQVLRHNGKAWAKFHKDIREGRKAHEPKFHTKKANEGIRFPIDKRRVESIVQPQNNRIFLTNLGWVNCRFSEVLLGRLTAITVKRRAGKWFAAIQAQDLPKYEGRYSSLNPKIKHFEDPNDLKGLVAIDVGISTRATASDGTRLLHDPISECIRKRKLKYERRFARKQRVQLKNMGLDPKKEIPKGTKVHISNRARQIQNKIAQFSLREVFSRKDAIHKYTTYLVENYHTIVVETLALHGMMQTLNRGFRRKAHASCMGELLRQLDYKCAWYSRNLIKVDRWFPSSKRCSSCGYINTKLKLAHREWACPSCEAHHDRDFNASINLWQEGARLLALPHCPTAGSAGRHARGGLKETRAMHRIVSTIQRDAKFFLPQAQAFGQESAAEAVGRETKYSCSQISTKV